MQIFVTGGAGFIGSHLVKLLVAQGHTVHVFDDLSSGRFERISGYGEAVQFTRGDVRDAEAVAAAMQGAGIVFHLAALVSVVESVEHPPKAYATNVLGTVHVLEAARRLGVQRVVQASTCAVYGNTEQLPVSEQTPVQPLSPYASTKLAAEQAGQLYQQLYGLATVALRFFNVYGPGQDPASPYAAVVPRFIAALRAGEQPCIFGDGLQSRDFVFVGDIVQA
ncbi:MAG: NAD-dependent epimerase/dehydratase family protein, partial [Chloroflexia bacterium]|nr:NAD-dependent epimerase/dehydratase family protein [Chloroflexia bacterium]